MKSIAFIVPYFGNFPFWMGYFIESCRTNSSIEFLFFSDNPAPEGLPDNIKYQQISFEAYKNRVSRSLNIHFDPDSAYKLCDIKPAYGFIHQEELCDYDFWGFCDIDLIFGDIRKFVTDEILQRYDYFSAYDRRVSGHFFLARNNPEAISAFKQAKFWVGVFEDKNHHCFDEKAFSDLFVRFKNHPAWSRKLLTWIRLPYSRKAYFKEQFSTPGLRYDWVDGSRNFPTEWYWKQGALTNNASAREFLYFHFLKWKREWGDQEQVIPHGESWVISRNGFEG